MKSQLENNDTLWIDSDSNFVTSPFYLNTSTCKAANQRKPQLLLKNFDKLEERIKKASKTADQSYVKAPLKTTSYK